MIKVGKKLVSEDILNQSFFCHLNSCKGSCCVKGESGAPLEKSEVDFLVNNIEKIKPFLTSKGKKSIQQNGVSTTTSDGNFETTLIDGGACSFISFNSSSRITSCGIEKAYSEGVIDFKKPISCHLYPIRTKPIGGFEILNYHNWQICSPALKNGNSKKTPMYKFLESALIRKFGKQWYYDLVDKANKINVNK